MSDEPIRPFPGSVADWAAGNGCLVRLCPVALFFQKFPAVAVDRSVDSVKVTHGSQIAMDTCRCLLVCVCVCVSICWSACLSVYVLHIETWCTMQTIVNTFVYM